MNRARRLALCRCLTLMLGGAATLGAQAGDLADLKARGELRHLGVVYANFVTGAGDGLDVELVQGFARSLGVRVGRLRGLVYGLGSLLTAIAVTTVGSVGFVGLIVPHLVRLLIGNDQRLLLPAATLAGGVLLCAADTAARTVVAPIQLPVGVLTALIGVPVFLFLLARHPR